MKKYLFLFLLIINAIQIYPEASGNNSTDQDKWRLIYYAGAQLENSIQRSHSYLKIKLHIVLIIPLLAKELGLIVD
ncbi:MAG TPA: hypothetical protein PLP33_17085 [Leptospiraceae bacterium]|nr:hypothetical protein [Leptospiraceae bacterium]